MTNLKRKAREYDQLMKAVDAGWLSIVRDYTDYRTNVRYQGLSGEGHLRLMESIECLKMQNKQLQAYNAAYLKALVDRVSTQLPTPIYIMGRATAELEPRR